NDKLILSVDVSKYSKVPAGLSSLTIFIILGIGIVAFIVVSFFYVKKREHKVSITKHHKRSK
ncbi:MAG: hypothetical protein HYS80_02445, partial [Candidatus Aenigmarchaeota archaeon]|nr:hypothetical protein [Candidatus Aenigmarchaeota archaeon]